MAGGFLTFRIYEASAPLKAIYGSNLSVKLSSTKIYNMFSEPIVICGTLSNRFGARVYFMG
jgi:hypothetical protein